MITAAESHQTDKNAAIPQDAACSMKVAAGPRNQRYLQPDFAPL
jgi:hypothetical protein